MDDKEWRTFVTVVDEGNITRAAEKLFLSQPAEWNRWSSNTSKAFPAPLFYWQTVCRTRWLRLWKSPHGYGDAA